MWLILPICHVWRIEIKTYRALQVDMICVCASEFIYVQHTLYVCFKKQDKFQQNTTLALETRNPSN